MKSLRDSPLTLGTSGLPDTPKGRATAQKREKLRRQWQSLPMHKRLPPGHPGRIPYDEEERILREENPTPDRDHFSVVVPGLGGLDCIFYTSVASHTAPLCDRVYIRLSCLGRTFRPRPRQEHVPLTELAFLCRDNGDRGFGEGVESLKVGFLCYSLPGSGAGKEVEPLVMEAMEATASMVGESAKAQEEFSWSHGARQAMSAARAGYLYLPPEDWR